METIVKQDAFVLMDELKDETVDLFIIDPPYNLNKAEWDNVIDYWPFMNKILQKVSEKIKKTGSVYFFNTAYNSALLTANLAAYYPKIKYRQWITWYKIDAAGNPSKLYHNAQESIVFCTGTSEDYTFNRDAIRIPYTSITKQRYKGNSKGRRWNMDPKGALCKDVWEILSERHWHRRGVVGTKKGLHPTIKPTELIRRIVLASSNEGDFVVDPFLGSGTSAVVCKSLNREFLGCDKYGIDLASFRLQQQVL